MHCVVLSAIELLKTLRGTAAPRFVEGRLAKGPALFFLSKAGRTSGRKKAARQCKVGSPIGPKSVEFRRDKGPKSVAGVAQKEQQHVAIGTQQVGNSETRKKWFAASRTDHVVSSNERVPRRK